MLSLHCGLKLEKDVDPTQPSGPIPTAMFPAGENNEDASAMPIVA
jgi:hypothetical protein